MRERANKVKGRTAAGWAPLAPEQQARLESQVARVVTALEEEAGQEAIRELVTPDPQDPAWDAALMAALGTLNHSAIPPLLGALFSEVRDKVRRKALKKALHLLKSRGVKVPADLLPREAVSLGAPRPGAVAAAVTPIFGNGDSYVILEGPPEILGGNFLVSRTSETEGLKECVLLTLKRREQAEFWNHFREQGLEEWFSPPPAYAVRMLEEAYRVRPDNDAGYRYAAVREKIFQHWGRPEDAPDLDQVLPRLLPEERGRMLEYSRKMAFGPLFRSWIPGEEEILPWLEKFEEVRNSPLVLSEQQKQVRMDAALDEATQALYPPETRGDWGRRLRCMAYYLYLKGWEEGCRAALAAAEDLANPDRGALTGENPFLKSLVQGTLRLVWEMQHPQETPAASGLVAPPGETRLIRR
jgi:hypothetical protein